MHVLAPCPLPVVGSRGVLTASRRDLRTRAVGVECGMYRPYGRIRCGLLHVPLQVSLCTIGGPGARSNLRGIV
ncbi:hypothetical protein DB35_09520 [Streptomyces abyssalis]|nr:hypothetical protein DB35_09520 [Streptomyces abyssalis]OEV29386.1 hypothetical protein AN219_16735 [Streptomyces nanshensis]